MIKNGEIETLHEPFAEWLKERQLPYVHANPTRKATIQKGHPDFTVLLPGNKFILIEFKVKGGRFSPDQKKRIAELEKAEVKVYVLSDLASAKRVVLEALKGIFSAVSLPTPDPTLKQHQGWVYEPDPLDGMTTFSKKRRCGPGDAHLPQLFPAK